MAFKTKRSACASAQSSGKHAVSTAVQCGWHESCMKCVCGGENGAQFWKGGVGPHCKGRNSHPQLRNGLCLTSTVA